MSFRQNGMKIDVNQVQKFKYKEDCFITTKKFLFSFTVLLFDQPKIIQFSLHICGNEQKKHSRNFNPIYLWSIDSLDVTWLFLEWIFLVRLVNHVWTRSPQKKYFFYIFFVYTHFVLIQALVCNRHEYFYVICIHISRSYLLQFYIIERKL